MNRAELAAELKRLRVTAGFARQADLAEKLDVDTSTITHIEAGTRQPSMDVLLRWLDACNADLALVELNAPPSVSEIEKSVRTLRNDDMALLLRVARVLPKLPPALRAGFVSGMEDVARGTVDAGVSEPPRARAKK